jgi:hypothetical protein
LRCHEGITTRIGREQLRAVAEASGVGVAFFFAAVLGLRVGLPDTSASPVGIAADVSLAGTLLFGRHVLIGVFVAAVLAEHTINPLPLSLALAAAHVIEQKVRERPAQLEELATHEPAAALKALEAGYAFLSGGAPRDCALRLRGLPAGA